MLHVHLIHYKGAETALQADQLHSVQAAAMIIVS